MATYDSESWTGRKPYAWAKDYFFLVTPLFIIQLGPSAYYDAFVFSFSCFRRKSPAPFEQKFSFNYTKIFVGRRAVMNG